MAVLLTRAAVHEAGHLVVATALGRTTVRVFIGHEALPADHPHDASAGARADGGCFFSPPLGAEIVQHLKDGRSLEPDEVEWLAAELVMCFGGPVAEDRRLGDVNEEGAVADREQANAVLNNLLFAGEVTEARRAVVWGAAEKVADSILAELSRQHAYIASALSRDSSELDESAAAHLLEQAGMERGSHRDLLAGIL